MTARVDEDDASTTNSWQSLNQPRLETPPPPTGEPFDVGVDQPTAPRDPLTLLLIAACSFVAVAMIVMLVADRVVDRQPTSAVLEATSSTTRPVEAPESLPLGNPTPAPTTTTTPVVGAEMSAFGELLDEEQGQVLRLFVAAFGRMPDPEGFSYWTDERRRGVPTADIAAVFVETEEFKQQFDSATSDVDVVSVFYRNLLGRDGDPDGIDYWVGQRAAGLGNAQLLLAIADSAESRAATGTD
jgi:hypothetical protein